MLKYGLGSYYGSARDTAECAQLAEEAGWDGLFIGDAIWCMDPIVALSAAAMVTSRIKLGTMIIPMPLRRPWKVASRVARPGSPLCRAADPRSGRRGSVDGLAGLSR